MTLKVDNVPSGMLSRLLPGRNGGSVLGLFGIETRVCDGASGVCVKLQRAPAKRYRLRTKANEAVEMSRSGSATRESSTTWETQQQ